MDDPSSSGLEWHLLAVVLLIVVNGFFVAAEFALVTVRKTRIDQLVSEGHPRAAAVRRALDSPDSYIAATQLGITMASIALGWVGEPALVALFEPGLRWLPAAVAWPTAHGIAVASAFALVTALHITLGELAPKTVALERAEATALLVAGPTEWFLRLFWPFIRVMNAAGRGIVRLAGLDGTSGHAMVHSEEELKMLVTASLEAGVLEAQEQQMLHRVFDFANVTAGHVMLPRTELVAVEEQTAGPALLAAFATSGMASLPVYRSDLDNMTGMVHAVDVLAALSRGEAQRTAGALARDALTVPETMAADDVLASLRQRRQREAIVLDEYGGTAGLVTFDWLMERIVGAAGQGQILVDQDGGADIDGLALVHDVNEQFALGVDERRYTTVGGYVLGQLGRRARVGDTMTVAGRALHVTAVDGLRVSRVRLAPPQHEGAVTGGDEADGIARATSPSA